jgi:hypothetical protein
MKLETSIKNDKDVTLNNEDSNLILNIETYW